MNYPQVALEFMNRDHAEFTALLQKILISLPPAGTDENVDALLQTLLDHTRRHFAEEEREMQATGFPPYPMHHAEHERVLGAMAERVADWRTQRDHAVLKAWLEGPVSDWFVNHVSSMDTMTARYIAACHSEKKD